MLKQFFFEHRATLSVIVWWLLVFLLPRDSYKEVCFYGGGSLLLLLFLWRERRVVCSLHVLSLSVFLYFLVLLFSLAMSKTWYEGLFFTTQLFVWMGLTLLFSRFSEQQFLLLFQVSVFVATGIALMHLSHLNVLFWRDDAWFVPPIGHVSFFSDVIALHLPMALFLLFTSSSWQKRVFWGASFFVLLSGVWFAGTRSTALGVLSAFLFGSFFLFQRRFFSRRKAIMIFVVLFVVGIGAHFCLPRAQRGTGTTFERLGIIYDAFFDGREINEVTAGRWFPALATFDMIKESAWFGSGPASFRFLYPKFVEGKKRTPGENLTRFWYMHPHNEILHQLSIGGIIGTVFFLLTCFSFFSFALRNAQFETILCLAGIVIALTSWQMSTTFLFPLVQMLVALLVAFVWKKISENIQPWKQFSLSSLFLVPFVVFMGVIQASYQASYFAIKKSHERGLTQEQQFQWAKWAYMLAPGSFDASFSYAARSLHFEPFDVAKKRIEQLYETYPYVPAVLVLMAELSIKEELWDRARNLLQEALFQDPEFRAAQFMLEEVEKNVSLAP